MMRSSEKTGLRCPQLGTGCVLRRADVYQAVDRPDRLELDVLPVEPDGVGEGEVAERLRPERVVELWHDGRRLFSGRIERCGLTVDHTAWCWRAVAYAEYESLRQASREDAGYYERTDSEIANEIASELGLRSHVERTVEVHSRIDRRGDPLRFLRARARANAFELGVTGGVLYFASAIPALDALPLRVSRPADLVALDVQNRGVAGRGGRLDVPGDARWRPLAEFDVTGFGAAWDARYRVVRSRHLCSPRGFLTRVEFLEEGTDFSRWSREEDMRDG